MTQDKKQQKVLQHHEGEPQGEAAH
ncbi:MAG: hypothetical protein RIR17_226, partial [Planctomycetota bacterium]